MIARTVQELRVALPEADDLLAGLLRVAEATRTVLEVDGAGLTLVHADGPPRWVAATDAANHPNGSSLALAAHARGGTVAASVKPS
jgi:hypothetical protein